MKFYKVSILCIASLLILSSCAKTPTPPSEIKVDTSLPEVVLTQNGVIVDMKTVAFEWNSIKDPRVEGVYIYRQDPTSNESDFVQYAVVNNRFQTHYLDQGVEPQRLYQYKFRTFSKEGYGAESNIVSARTLPLLSSVSWIHSIAGMPRSAKIIWRPHASERVNSYIIERKTLDADKWEEVGSIRGRLNAEYIDEGLKDGFVYVYRIKSVTYDDIVSMPSQAVKVVTKPLPKSIAKIETTKELPKKIKLTWERSLEPDFMLYHVYRSEKIDGSYELIAKLQKSNTFVDEIGEDGKSYFYRVSVVDKDGLESEHQKNSVHGVTRPKPATPIIVDAKLSGASIELMWSKSDVRNVSFIVERVESAGWFKSKTEVYEGIKTEHFSDRNILADMKYTYSVYGVDKDKIRSKPSAPAEVITPESLKVKSSAKQVRPKKEVRVAPKIKEVEQEEFLPMQNLDLSEI